VHPGAAQRSGSEDLAVMTPTHRTRLLSAALGAGALALAVGCSGAGASPTAKSLVERAIAATESTTSITFAGSVSEASEKITLRVSSNEVTGEGQGQLTINGGTAQMRLVSGVVYLNADKTFWTLESGASVADQLAGQWVSTAASTSNGKELSVFVNGKEFLDELFSPNLKNSTFSLTGTSTVGGKQATVISGHDTTAKSTGKLFVAKSGKPYILKLVLHSSEGSGEITFSGFNKAVVPVAPDSSINLDAGSSG
jgi:hypothetical protein